MASKTCHQRKYHFYFAGLFIHNTSLNPSTTDEETTMNNLNKRIISLQQT